LLIDGLGSRGTADAFFAPLLAAGGQLKRFNANQLGRLALRDHRKLLLVDAETAFVVGCNLADEYDGDGVTAGWRDDGVGVRGCLVSELETEFAAQWRRADAARWHHPPGGYARNAPTDPQRVALCIKPGFGPSAFRAALRRDLACARDITITSAYFLPGRRLLRQLRLAVRRGARVRLLLAGQTDVAIAALACRALYPALVRAGIEVYEYQPQILHAKSIALDDVVFTGSSNLDPRSLRLNFELMLRLEDAALARQVRAQFDADLGLSRRVDASIWAGWSAWMRLKQRAARVILAELDPWVARAQLLRH
jgi:cardiolipin synthase A/B